MDAASVRARIEEHVRRDELISPRGAIPCLVSGGADSTCLWHALGALGYRVSALHVDHGLRGAESDGDADFCRRVLGATLLAPHGKQPQRPSEASLRALRYRLTDGYGLRATAHTA